MHPTPTDRARTASSRRPLVCGRPLVLFAHLLAAAFAGLVAAGPAAGQVVEGRVVDGETDRPVRLARVSLTDTLVNEVVTVFTGDDGRFRLQASGAGSYLVRVDALGYRTMVDGIYDLGDEAFLPVEVRLRPSGIRIEGITVSVEQLQQDLRDTGFFERRDAGFGTFISPEDLVDSPVLSTTEALRFVPGIRTVDGGVTGGAIRCRDGSAPRVYVDGAEVRLFPPGSLDSYVDLEAVAGIEVYTRASSLPLQYGGTRAQGLGDCVILVWTRSAPGR